MIRLGKPPIEWQFIEDRKDMSKEDPYKGTLERIKRKGQIDALMRHLYELKFQLTHRNWSGIRNGSTYIRFEGAMDIAESILEEMRATFNELKKIDPDQR
jgi:hypothetical protein